MAALGSLFVSLGIDSAEFTGGLTKAEHQLNQFVNATSVRIGAVAGIVSAGVSGLANKLAQGIGDLTNVVPDVIKSTASLKDLGEQTGNSAVKIGALQDIAKATGSNFEAFTAFLEKLSKNLANADDKTTGAGRALVFLGIEARDGTGKLKDSADVALEAAIKLNTYADGAGKVALAVALGGKAAAAALPFLKELGDAGQLNATTTLQQIEASDRYEKQLAKLKTENEKLVRVVSLSLLPVLQGVVTAFRGTGDETDGLKGKIKGLADDNSIADFAENIVNFAGTSIDAVDKLSRLFQILGNDIGAFGARLVTEAIGIKDSLALAFTGDFSGARKAFEDTQAASKGVADALEADNTRISSRVLFGDTLKAQVAKARAAAEAAKNAPAAAAKPQAGFIGDTAAGAGDAILAKQLEGRLKAIQAAADAQKQALDAEAEFYNRFYSGNLISTATYYDQRQRIADDGLRSELAAIDAQVAAIRAAEAKQLKGADREASENKIADLIAKRSKAEVDAANKTALLGLDRLKSDDDYKRDLQSLNAQILELQGNLQAAALIRFDQQNESLRKRLIAAGDTAGLAKDDELRRFAAAQGEINEQSVKAQRLQDQLSNAERRVDLQRQAGSLSELGAAAKLTAARQASITDLQAIADNYRRIALESGNPRLIQDADNFQLKIEELAASSDVLKNKFQDIFTGGATDFFTEIITGSKSAKDAFSDFAKSIQQQIARLVAQDLATSLFKSASGSSGEGGGIFGSLAGIFAGLFGGGLAGGGPASSGKFYQVAENGPEVLNTGGKSYLLMGQQAGNVVPLRGDVGGGRNFINITVPQDTSRATSAQVATATGNAVARAQRRNG